MAKIKAETGEAPAGTDLVEQLLNPKIDRRLRQLPRLIAGATRLVWAAAPRELALCGGLQLIGGLLVVGQLLVARSLLTKLLGARVASDYSSLIPEVVLLTVVFAVVGMTNVSRLGFQQLLAELVTRHAFNQIIEVATRVDLQTFETPGFHDRLERAMINAGSRPLQMTTGVLALMGSLFGVLGISIALISIQPLLFLLALVAVIPLWLVGLSAGRSLYRFGFRQTQRDRRRIYLQLLLTGKDSAKELRSYALSQPLQHRYCALYAERIADLRSVLRSRITRSALGSLATSLMMGAALAFLVWLIKTGRLSLAGAGAAGAALLLLATQLQTLVSGAATLYESALFIQDFSSFVAERVPETGFRGAAAPPLPLASLEAEGVQFTYPGQSKPALTGATVRLEKGQIIALVGENGSGKSTMAKLLAGLYQPEKGVIRWNEHDVSGLDISQVRDAIAVLFQDFVHYQLTVRENITLGRYAHEDRADIDDLVAAAAATGGAQELIARLAEGLRTQLGPQFAGGTELSGGQWQRIALARAFFRDAPLVILDEPTAALDPRAEAELFTNVRHLFAGRTVLLISHRFASVRDADRIYVLDKGSVVEQGTHAELIEREGLYSELYDLQAASYLDKQP